MKKLRQYVKGNSLRAQLLKGAGGSAGIQAANLLLTLVSGVLLARILGPESYGNYAFVISIITLLSLPVKAGLPTLLIREVAKNQLCENWGLMKGLLKSSHIFSTGYFFSIISLVIIWHFFTGNGDNDLITAFSWALLLLPLMAFGAIREGTLRGLRRVVKAQAPEKIVRPLTMVTLAGLVALTGSNLSSLTAIQFNLVGAFIAFILGSFFLFNALPNDIRKARPEYDLTSWAKGLAPLSLFAGLKLLDSQTSILFLGFLATEEETGLFRVAATGSSLVAFGLTAVNMAMAPQVARLYNAGDIHKLQRIISLSTRAAAAIAFPVAITFIFFGKPLIGLVFGEEYTPAAPALALLCLGQLINTTAGSVALVLNMTGNEKSTVMGAAIALACNFLLAALLIPSLGLMGAAIGFTASLSIWNIYLMLMAKKKVGINTFLGAK